MMEALRARGSRAYVIILTAYDSFTYARSALRLGSGGLPAEALPRRGAGGGGDQAAPPYGGGRERDRPRPAGAEEGGQEQVCPPGDGLHRPALRGPEHLCGGDRPAPGAEREPFEPPVPARETDYTLLNYLTRYRIHKAMELLRDCRTKVYEVAERVGYRDITYFSATFKK